MQIANGVNLDIKYMVEMRGAHFNGLSIRAFIRPAFTDCCGRFLLRLTRLQEISRELDKRKKKETKGREKKAQRQVWVTGLIEPFVRPRYTFNSICTKAAALDTEINSRR